MTRRRLLRIIVPLLLALVATLIVARATARPSPKEVPLLTAATYVPAGATLSAQDLEIDRVAPAAVLPGSLTTLAQAEGQVAKVGLSAGSPVLSDEVEPQSRAGLAYQIPLGERALTLAVNGVSGVAGNLVPGAHVDVLLTVGAQSASGGQAATVAQSTLIAQNIDVLSTGLAGSSGQSGYALVTLAVTPSEAATIALGQQQGSVLLLLRPPADNGTGTIEIRVGGIVP